MPKISPIYVFQQRRVEKVTMPMLKDFRRHQKARKAVEAEAKVQQCKQWARKHIKGPQ
jgi:hypothetical protein